MNTQKIGRTRKAKSKQTVIAFHADGMGDAHPAINVKVQSLPVLEVSEQNAEIAYEITKETFWHAAQSIAHQHGYSGVFSEGRSGGWLLPFYQYRNGKLWQPMEWDGQGPDKGYPSYPDVTDAQERKRFAKFRADILELLADVPNQYRLNAEVR